MQTYENEFSKKRNGPQNNEGMDNLENSIKSVSSMDYIYALKSCEIHYYAKQCFVQD